MQRNLPSIRPKLGMNVHYVFPPAPTVSITINGGMQMPGWFDLYDWPIGLNARDDRDGKIAAAEQIEKVRLVCALCASLQLMQIILLTPAAPK